MSLSSRIERAQQAAARAAAEAAAEAAPEAPAQPPVENPAEAGSDTAADATTEKPAQAVDDDTAWEAVPAEPSTALRSSAPEPEPPVTAVATVPVGSPSQYSAREEWLREIRRRLQDEVVGASHALFEASRGKDLRGHVDTLVDRFLSANALAVNRDERLRLSEEVVAEVTGLGPIEPLIADPTITEVMVNGPEHIYIERKGKISRVPTTFLNDDHVLRIIDRIITPLGRRIDQSSPRVDARLPDGSRVNCIIEPLSLIGPVITIRKFSQRPYTVEDLVGFGTASPEMFDFLRACVEARLNLFVSGGTGSGKTTTLNVISAFVPEEERIITIEDAAELQLRQEHVVTLEARPPNLEGLGEITTRDLLRNALHMRPDRIIVGECRGGEALDMIQAMTVGQEGSLSTGHANSAPDMLRRLETMILMSGYEMPLRSIREQIASAVDLIVHTARLGDGSRKIMNITEVYGIEDDQILTQDVFEFKQTGVDENGRIVGTLQPTGVRPTFMPKFAASGIDLPEGEFGIPAEGTVQVKMRLGKGRSIGIDAGDSTPQLTFGLGKAVNAGGMVYVSSVGPVNPETGRLVGETIRAQVTQVMENLKALLEAEGSSLEKIAWANWSLRDPQDFDTFNEEWHTWFPAEAPVGQMTLMPPQQRRAGFRLSLGVIAQADGTAAGAATGTAPGATQEGVPQLPAGGERRRGERRRGERRTNSSGTPPGGEERRHGERRRGERRRGTGAQQSGEA